MALAPVAQVAPPPKETKTSGRKSGGKFGTIAGLAAGAALGATVVATGGAAAPAAAPTLGAIAYGGMQGAGAGAALGGLLGEQVKPGRQATSAIERRLEAPGPQLVHSEASEKLKQSLLALQTAPPDARAEYAKPLFGAYMSSLANDNSRGTA